MSGGQNLGNDGSGAALGRAKLMEELSATNSYVSWMKATTSDSVRNVLSEIIKDEQQHTGKLLNLLISLDPQQCENMEAGAQGE